MTKISKIAKRILPKSTGCLNKRKGGRKVANKEEFCEIYRKYITREGSEELLDYLTGENSDFFTAPASTRFHGNFEGGLCEHSLNVYRNLKEYLSRPYTSELFQNQYSEESIALVALLHDICKTNCYKTSFRNTKNEMGQWIKVPYFEFEDNLPYGHGEKSVYIISGFMKLSREEAFAIRYHMGFSGTEDARNISKAYEMYPLAFALSVADMEASFYLEETK